MDQKEHTSTYQAKRSTDMAKILRAMHTRGLSLENPNQPSHGVNMKSAPRLMCLLRFAHWLVMLLWERIEAFKSLGGAEGTGL